MILGVGTDLTSIARIGETLSKQGDRFINRCFSPSEQDYINTRSGDDADMMAAGYAKRWAAKEACAKALGLGIRDDIYLKDIIVENDAQGKPSIRLQEGALARLQSLTPPDKQAEVNISLSDDAGMALAFVVISCV